MKIVIQYSASKEIEVDNSKFIRTNDGYYIIDGKLYEFDHLYRYFERFLPVGAELEGFDIIDA